MKRCFSVFICISLVVLGLTGCPEKKESAQAPENKAPQANESSAVTAEPAVENAKADEVPEKEVETIVKVEKEIIVDKYDEIDLANMQVHPLQFFPNEKEMYPYGTGRENPLFYCIGFSKDGKMAYYIVNYNDGKGSTDHIVCIQDLVTDEMLWRTSTEDSGPDASFIKKCKEYNIEYVKTKFEKLPIKINGNEYDASVKFAERKTDPEVDMFPKADYIVSAIKNGSKKKVLAKVEDVYSYRTVVCGIIKNPYENRVAVIIGNQEPIFEGAQYNFYVYGCDLDSNFN